MSSGVIDKVGNVWIGTQNGLVKYDWTYWINFNTNNSQIPANFITAIAYDDQTLDRNKCKWNRNV